jgi:hypothetical protein
MDRYIALQAQIVDDGRIFIVGGPHATEVTGLYHLLHANDSLAKAITMCLAMNEAARGKGPNPACFKEPLVSDS